MTKTIDALVKLADAYAESSFDQGLHKRTKDPEPEKHREALVAALAQARAEQAEPVKFLANGTRFKMAFFDSEEDGCGNVGTYVTCFEGFEKELDGRWVALVAAEDDCHMKLTTPPAAPVAKLEPLTPRSPISLFSCEMNMFKLGWLEAEAAHNAKLGGAR